MAAPVSIPPTIPARSAPSPSILTAPPARGSDAAGDMLTSIEQIIGSAYDDTSHRGNRPMRRCAAARATTSSSAPMETNDTLYGEAGNDTLSGGVGADSIDGGAGTDTATYASSLAGVTVYLDGSVSSGGDADGDVLTSHRDADRLQLLRHCIRLFQCRHDRRGRGRRHPLFQRRGRCADRRHRL
jgi:hypothetical protein